MYITQNGIQITSNYIVEYANSGKGLVFRAPDSTGNANTFRVMEPTDLQPSGYIKITNKAGRYLDIRGNPKDKNSPDTHISLR